MHKTRGSISEMARRHRPRSLWRPLMLIYLYAPSNAIALSMINFQIITSQKISSKCMSAYSTPISGCAITDFIIKESCSASCVQGLEVVAERIESACSDEDVDSDTLLGMILEGKLVNVLCPGSETSSTFTTTVQATTATAIASQDTTRLPNTTPISISTTQTPDATFVSTITTSSLPQLSTTDTAPDTSTTRPTFTLGTSPTSTITPAPTSTTAEETQPETTADSDGPDFLPGGGSPFDRVPVRSSGENIRQPTCNIIASLFALSIIAMLL